MCRQPRGHASCAHVVGLASAKPVVAHAQVLSNEDGALRSPSGYKFPPCIVLERGESLDEFARNVDYEFITIMQARFCRMHDGSLVAHSPFDAAISDSIRHSRTCSAVKSNSDLHSEEARSSVVSLLC